MIARGPAPAVTLHEYTERIHVLRQALDRVLPHHAHSLDVIARHMEALGQVQITGGTPIATPVATWGGLLASESSPKVRWVRLKLDALDSALRAARPGRWQAVQLRQLDTVLRDPRFHQHLNPVQAAEGWLGDRVTQLLTFLAHHISFGGMNRYSILNAVVAIAFLLLVAGVAILIARAAMHKSAVSMGAPEQQTAVVSPMAARQRASEMASAGSYREAFRYLFLGTLIELRDAGLIQLRPGDTNREYVFSLGSAAGTRLQRDALVALVDEFDRVWYGHQALTRAEYERCASLAASVTEPTRPGRTA